MRSYNNKWIYLEAPAAGLPPLKFPLCCSKYPRKEFFFFFFFFFLGGGGQKCVFTPFLNYIFRLRNLSVDFWKSILFLKKEIVRKVRVDNMAAAFVEIETNMRIRQKKVWQLTKKKKHKKTTKQNKNKNNSYFMWMLFK